MFRTQTVNGERKLYLNEAANDLWIREVVFPGKKDGYFVEAGAADGFRGSCCFFLERHLGWRGICIEPNDEFFPSLARSRPGSVHENVCLANEAGWVDFAMGSTGGVAPFLSGIRESLMHKTNGGEVLAAAPIVRKRAEKLETLLQKHGAPPVIEYGAFDIEGSEYEALRSFPFDEYRFLALSFEVDGSILEPLSALLLKHGYSETRNPFNQDSPWEHYWLHESYAGPPSAM